MTTGRLEPADVREVRSQMREWRRGRATTTLREVLSEAYVVVFSALVLLSMLASVVVNLARVSDSACVSDACLSGRAVLPWLACGLVVLATSALTRLFGPVFSSPADVSWLLGAPLPRHRLLRPRFLATLAATALLSAALAVAALVLGGLRGWTLIVATALVTVASLLAVGLAAWAQGRRPQVPVAATVLVGVAVWSAALALAAGRLPHLAPPRRVPLPLVVLAVLVASAAVGTSWAAASRLARLRRQDLAAGGALVPGLSGAAATLDLALLYDVVLAHRWRARGSVRPRRGGPRGPWAIAWADVVRLRRRPWAVLALLSLVVVPWTVDAAGLGVAVVPVAVVAGFLGALPLLGGLRVMARSPSLRRALPFPPRVSQVAALALPLLVLVVFGLATAPAVAAGMELDPGTGAGAGLAVGVGALACAVRWVTGRPPDYGRPLVSTPAGAVPPNLYGSIVRGFDVAVLASAPLLVAPTGTGVLVSLALSAGVLTYLCSRD